MSGSQLWHLDVETLAMYNHARRLTTSQVSSPEEEQLCTCQDLQY